MGSSKAKKEARKTQDKDNVVSKLAEKFGRSVRPVHVISPLVNVPVLACIRRGDARGEMTVCTIFSAPLIPLFGLLIPICPFSPRGKSNSLA